MDELMTIDEAVALHWPDGPISAPTLRVAIRDGALPVAVIAGRFFVSRRALAEMTVCRLRPEQARCGGR